MATQLQESRSNTAALWLRFVSWLFKLAGSLFGVIALFLLAPIVMRHPRRESDPSYWFSFLLVSGFAIALVGIGMLLARRSRVAAILALIITLYPTAFVLSGERPLHWSDVLVSVITLTVIASIWPQLSWQGKLKRTE